MHQPTYVINVRIKNKHWFDDQYRHAFWSEAGGSSSVDRDRSRENWEEFIRCQVRANVT